MQHIEHNLISLRRRIMRRVWYRYVLSLVLSRAALTGIFFGFSTTLFFKLVSVPNIIMNLLNVQLGALPQYVWQVLVNTFINGEFLKLVTLALFVYFLFYLRSLLKGVHMSGDVAHSV